MPAPSDMRAGDIMLYRGRGLISWAIRFFDGRPVSHAGLYLGGQEVGEAVAAGVVRRGFDTSVDGAEWVEYRRLKGPALDMTPVTDRAGLYLDQAERYAYEQIILLVGLSLTRKLHVNRFLLRALRAVLDRGARLVARLIGGGREPMICSEFVFRCYEEANPAGNDPYTLRVAPWPWPFAPPVTAGAPAGAPAGLAPLSRGVHPDSLVAWFADLSAVRVGATAATIASGLETELPPLDAATDEELESALREYRDAAGEEDGAAAAASIRTPDVYARINRFLGLYAAAVGTLPPRGGPVGPGRPVGAGERPVDRPVEGAIAMDTLRLFDSTAALLWEGPERLAAAVRPVADFVTPGDLYDCGNLREVGRIG